MRNAVPFSLLVAASFAVSCSSYGGPTCTDIGCGPSLAIDLVPTPTGSYRVEAVVPGSDTRKVFECPDATRCIPGAAFGDFWPEEVVVRVTTGAGTSEQTLRPSYQEFRPNGRRCEPTCRQARIQFSLASMSPPS